MMASQPGPDLIHPAKPIHVLVSSQSCLLTRGRNPAGADVGGHSNDEQDRLGLSPLGWIGNHNPMVTRSRRLPAEIKTLGQSIA